MHETRIPVGNVTNKILKYINMCEQNGFLVALLSEVVRISSRNDLTRSINVKKENVNQNMF
jgi:L-2-hydroxyglutarate oxidase LhgO